MSFDDYDDFGELYNTYKKKEGSKKPMKTVGVVKPIQLPIWKEVKDSADHIACMVCKRDFDDEDIVEACDKCEHYFHYKHIREWLKIKGTCPFCKR